MKRSVLAIALGMSLLAPTWAADKQTTPAQVRQVHDSALVLDTHLDTPANFSRPGWSIRDRHDHDGDQSQVDLPRMKEGGLDGGFWVIYTEQGPRDEAGNRVARDHGLTRMVEIREMIAANAADF